MLGFRDEADAFKAWLQRTGAGRPEDLQIMYGIGGERFLPELEIDPLSGHRGSKPVRIGNEAVKQTQLDCYGQLMQAAYLYARAGGVLTEDKWRFLSGLGDIVQTVARADHGIWEIRDDPRHFVHSELNCWVALDRALRVAMASGVESRHWAHERDALARYLPDEATVHGWFPQAVGRTPPDASTLLVPAVGFAATTDASLAKTVEVVRARLERDGLVHRYESFGRSHRR